MWPNTPESDRKKKAIATLDELLTLHDDDEEGWFARAQIAEGPNAAVPYYKALLRLRKRMNFSCNVLRRSNPSCSRFGRILRIRSITPPTLSSRPIVDESRRRTRKSVRGF